MKRMPHQSTPPYLHRREHVVAPREDWTARPSVQSAKSRKIRLLRAEEKGKDALEAWALP